MTPATPSAVAKAASQSAHFGEEDPENAFGPPPEKTTGAGTKLRFTPAEAMAFVSLETLSGEIVIEQK